MKAIPEEKKRVGGVGDSALLYCDVARIRFHLPFQQTIMARPQHWSPMEATEKIKLGELRAIQDRWRVGEASRKRNRRQKMAEQDRTIGEWKKMDTDIRGNGKVGLNAGLVFLEK